MGSTPAWGAFLSSLSAVAPIEGMTWVWLLLGAPFCFMDDNTLALIRLLIARLERISADSFWAHRASGVKGYLLRVVEKSEKGYPIRRVELKRIVDLGFFILEKAARDKTE